MNYIEVLKDAGMCEIVGVHCSFSITSVNQMAEEFEPGFDIEGIGEDGIYKVSVMYIAPEFENGGCTEGGYWDFKVTDYAEFSGDQTNLIREVK